MFVALRNSFKGQTQIMHHNIPNITSILTDHCGCRLTFDVTNLRHVVFNFHPITKNWKLTQVQKVNTGKTRVLGRFINDFGSNYVSSLLSSTTGIRNVLWQKRTEFLTTISYWFNVLFEFFRLYCTIVAKTIKSENTFPGVDLSYNINWIFFFLCKYVAFSK